MQENKKKIFMTTTGERFLYENETRYIFVQFSIKDKLDADLIRQTADVMMERCPYFHTKPVLQNGRYCLAEQEAPVPVLKNDGYILTADERSQGFLMVISCSENTVYFCAHHALSDALGILRFVRSFAAEYLSRALGKNLHVPHELRPGQPVNEAEYEDPNEYIVHQSHPFRLSSAKGFSVPEEDISDKTHRTRYCVPADVILHLCRNAESSFSAFLAMLMNEAASRLYPLKDKPVKIYCPVGVRDMLGCPENMQNCVCGIDFVFPDEMKKMPFHQQLSCLKGMLLLRTSEEYLFDSLEKKKISHEELCKNAGSYENIREHYNKVRYATPMLSYVKKIELGDIAPYIADFDISIPVRDGCGFVMPAYCIGNKCLLNLESRMKSNDIFEAFEQALSKHGIPYEVLAREGFGAEDFQAQNWLEE